MKIIIIIFIFISSFSYSQDTFVNYTLFRSEAQNGNFETAINYFNLWIAKENNLDSIQRIFIDTDIEKLRKSVYWKLINDSIKSVYYNHYPKIVEQEISYSLWKIGAEDQKYRTLNKYFNLKIPNSNDSSYQVFIKKLVNEQNEREEIVYSWIKKYGWLDFKLVGQHAEKACFYIVQHSDYKLQKKCLPLLKTSVDIGNADPYHYAMMCDRICVSRGKKQIYGTQLKPKIGKIYLDENPKKLDAQEWELYNIKDEENVNLRRSELGLRPLEVDLLEKWGIKYVPK